jgi:hypothetical protein
LTPDKEPQVQGEEPKPQKEEPSGVDVDKDKSEVKGEEGSKEQSTPTTPPGKGTVGGLDIANTTQQALPPAFKIKITFDAMKMDHTPLGTSQMCHEWDIGLYVQVKLVKLNDVNQPLKFCNKDIVQLKNAEAFVEIPGESVESPKDYQPLSIFTVGSELNNCHPKPLPTDLPEVRKVLADKGSTRPYYANARNEIGEIQSSVSFGCKWTYVAPTGFSQGASYNTSLTAKSGYGFNMLESSPGYGKFVKKDATGSLDRVQINSCVTKEVTLFQVFCFYYTVDCSTCPAIRVHDPQEQFRYK